MIHILDKKGGCSLFVLMGKKDGPTAISPRQEEWTSSASFPVQEIFSNPVSSPGQANRALLDSSPAKSPGKEGWPVTAFSLGKERLTPFLALMDKNISS